MSNLKRRRFEVTGHGHLRVPICLRLRPYAYTYVGSMRMRMRSVQSPRTQRTQHTVFILALRLLLAQQHNSTDKTAKQPHYTGMN